MHNRCQSVSKSGSDSSVSSNSACKRFQTFADTFTASNRHEKRYIKRTVPALVHKVDSHQQTSTWKRPLVLRHKLQQLITPATESPLVSIYHQLEITFQFEHEFENIKAKIPIVIASIPPFKENPQLQLTNVMPLYHFEQNLSRLHDSVISEIFEEPSQVTEGNPVDESESLQPGAKYSILGEPHFALPVTSSSIDLLKVSNNSTDQLKISRVRSIRKFASANELCSLSRDSEDEEHADYRLLLPERPRTTTPLMQRRRGAQNHRLRPIDVDLANGIKKPVPLALPAINATQSRDNMATVDKNLMKSKARLQQAQRRATRVAIDDRLGRPATCVTNNSRQVTYYMGGIIKDDDADSTNSEKSSKFAESAISSSTSDSASKSEHTLMTRPPSPVNSTAPGLPAEIALIPQNAVQTSLVEESFDDPFLQEALSPALQTIASSTLHSPHTSQILLRSSTRGSNHGLPLSTAISLSRSSSALRTFPGSCTLDINEAQANSKPPPRQHRNLPPPPLPPLPPLPIPELQPESNDNPYKHLKLPPLPTEVQNHTVRTHRMTKLYVEDSDDEVIDPLPPIPERGGARQADEKDDNMNQEKDVPKLPRLSLGTAFNVNLAFGDEK